MTAQEIPDVWVTSSIFRVLQPMDVEQVLDVPVLHQYDDYLNIGLLEQELSEQVLVQEIFVVLARKFPKYLYLWISLRTAFNSGMWSVPRFRTGELRRMEKCARLFTSVHSLCFSCIIASRGQCGRTRQSHVQCQGCIQCLARKRMTEDACSSSVSGGFWMNFAHFQREGELGPEVDSCRFAQNGEVFTVHASVGTIDSCSCAWGHYFSAPRTWESRVQCQGRMLQKCAQPVLQLLFLPHAGTADADGEEPLTFRRS